MNTRNRIQCLLCVTAALITSSVLAQTYPSVRDTFEIRRSQYDDVVGDPVVLRCSPSWREAKWASKHLPRVLPGPILDTSSLESVRVISNISEKGYFDLAFTFTPESWVELSRLWPYEKDNTAWAFMFDGQMIGRWHPVNTPITHPEIRAEAHLTDQDAQFIVARINRSIQELRGDQTSNHAMQPTASPRTASGSDD
jgi:hypothetical protein